MPPVLPVYRDEREAGLAELIARPTPLLLTAALTRWDDRPAVVTAADFVRPERAKASVNDPDLHWLRSVLVTAGVSKVGEDGWNRNDDVFAVGEVWPARLTPRHKPFNLEHDSATVLGHIVSSWAMAGDQSPLTDDCDADDLPDVMHLGIGSVLYTVWDKEELQERTDRLLGEIAEGKWAVSMEVLYGGFDYVVGDQQGKARVVARGRDTAFLTKHLRAYGGDGTYRGERVGRLLRNLTFSGVGLVANPANPNSVILSSGTPATAAANISPPEKEQVYSPLPADSDNRSRSAQMTPEELKQFNDAKAAAETAKAEAEKAEKAKAAAEAALATKTKEADELTAKAAAQAKELETAKAELATASAGLTAANTKVSELTAQVDKQRAEARLVAAKDRLKDDAKAAEFVENTKALDDAAFAAVVALASMPAPQTPPKSTPAPTAPKGTPAATAGEKDPAGAAAAAATDLSAAVPTADAALSTVPPGDGVSDVQKAIASYIGGEDEAEGDESDSE